MVAFAIVKTTNALATLDFVDPSLSPMSECTNLVGRRITVEVDLCFGEFNHPCTSSVEPANQMSKLIPCSEGVER